MSTSKKRPIVSDKDIARVLTDLGILRKEEIEEISPTLTTYTSSEEVFIPKLTPSRKYEAENQPLEYYSSPLKIFEISNCIVSENGLISTSEGEIILESARSKLYRLINLVRDNTEGKDEWLNFVSYPHEHIFGSSSNIPKVGLSMSLIPYNGWYNNYYHWMLEILPQVRAFETYSKAYGRSPTLLLPPDPPDFATDLLSLAGLESGQWIELSSDSVSVERLILPEIHYWSGSEYSATSSEIDWLRKRLLPSVEVNEPSSSKKIYISRSDADSRNVKNEEDLTTLLEEFGFRKHVLSKYTPEKQIKIFNKASKVIAPHGAGLVNTIFGDDIEVFEFLGHKNQRLFFALLCGIGNIDYTSFFFNKIGGTNGQYVIDLSRLKKNLVQMEYLD